MKIYHMRQLPIWLRANRLVVMAALLLAIGAPFALMRGDTTAVAQSSAGALEPGRQAELIYLVRQDCGSCHGMTLKGGLGTPLLPEFVKDTPVEALVSIILDGVPDTPMPPWRGLLNETEATWIAQQLKKGLPK